MENNVIGQAEDRFLLYIDILNFTELVSKPGCVDEIYEVVDSLHVHRHDSFSTIIFSDTILVYNNSPARSLSDTQYLVMYLCEFAQDLFYRLVGNDTHYRAYITRGDFAHYSTKNIRDVFYGEALIDAYRSEKKIQAMGLFMSQKVVPFSNIYRTTPFDGTSHFVYIMQSLQRAGRSRGWYPLDPDELVSTGEVWSLAHDIQYLKNIHRHKTDKELRSDVRMKYVMTWELLLEQHREFMLRLEENNFDPRAIALCDWTEPLRRVHAGRG